MSKWKKYLVLIFYSILVLSFIQLIYLVSDETVNHPGAHIILDANEYKNPPKMTVAELLYARQSVQPFNLAALIIFICAVCHIFLAHQFHKLSEHLRENNRKKGLTHVDTFTVELLCMMGEVEIIFGLWVVPLMIAITVYYDWNTAVHYLNNINYTEPLFVVVTMALASTKPIIEAAENLIAFIASLGSKTVKAWWLSILTLGPILGSFITEPAAMTISAILLAKQFYQYKPSTKLAYATLGLLFVNISVGGVLTNFAAPPVLMVVKAWGWNTSFMFATFGLKAVCGILISNFLYLFYFNKEFSRMQAVKTGLKVKEAEKTGTPFGILLIHLMFLAWIVVHLHYPVVFLGTFLLFLGFYQVTKPYQNILVLRTPIMVGFFLSGLIIHGNLQGWWVSAILIHTSAELLLGASIILTAFNDNAQVTFLATLIPNFDIAMKYAVVAGAVAGGGITVIANAPNLAGQTLLQHFFKDGVSALLLFLGALIPTLILTTIFYLGRIT